MGREWSNNRGWDQAHEIARKRTISHLSGKSRAKCARFQNSKHEVRNPKQFQITEEAENSEPRVQNAAPGFEPLLFGFVSDFEIRDSGFPKELLVPAPPGWEKAERCGRDRLRLRLSLGMDAG
jgi:hypothetical protein